MYKIGQWYQYTDHPQTFRKCSSKRTDRLVYSEKIENGFHSYANDWGNYPFVEKNKECIPVDISVIAQYLPENHPDLLNFNPIYELW